MFEEEMLPFGKRTADMLIKIALDKTISNEKHVSHLPTSWGTLYQLTKIPDLKKAIEEGKIHADMQRKDVKALIPQKIKQPKPLEDL
jgi:hypothetical protein